MAIDTPARPVMDLRATAARAWAYQQAAIAQAEHDKIEAAREQFIAEARSFVRDMLDCHHNGSNVHIPGLPQYVERLAITVHGDPLNDDVAWTAEMVLFGEPFVFRYDDPQGPTEGSWGLRHQHTCLACGHWSESWPISNLADLGRWLERARAYCCHADRNGAY